MLIYATLVIFTFKYIDHFDSSHLQGNEVNKTIKRKLNDFINYIPSSKEKELSLKMIDEVYHKRYKSIGAKLNNDIKVMLSMIMALLIENNRDKKIERGESLVIRHIITIINISLLTGDSELFSKSPQS